MELQEQDTSKSGNCIKAGQCMSRKHRRNENSREQGGTGSLMEWNCRRSGHNKGRKQVSNISAGEQCGPGAENKERMEP